MLKITYDEQSRPAMVEYNGVWYGYVKNLQGDIVGIVDSNGTEVVKYSYDAWGKVMSTSGSKGGTLGKANPFRYRGYVYDEETGLYYLRSRYYNPEWGRFLNADVVLGDRGVLLTHNAFAYCVNKPINYSDADGNSPLDGVKERLRKLKEDVKRAVNYVKDALRSAYLLSEIKKTVEYDAETNHLRIPNNTKAAQDYFYFTGYQYDSADYQMDHYWAMEMAKVAVQKYEEETGEIYPIEVEKVAFEIRIHAQAYAVGLVTQSSSVTDVKPNETGKFQWIIDRLYEMGMR